jgi:hypothetical protein
MLRRPPTALALGKADVDEMREATRAHIERVKREPEERENVKEKAKEKK